MIALEFELIASDLELSAYEIKMNAYESKLGVCELQYNYHQQMKGGGSSQAPWLLHL